MSPCLGEKQTRANQIQGPCGHQFRGAGAEHDVSSVILLAKVPLSLALASIAEHPIRATTFIGQFLSSGAYLTNFLTAHPFGVAAQREIARAAGGVAALVVEPKRHAGGFGQVDDAQKGWPLHLVVQVSVEGDVTSKAAEALRRQRLQLLALFFGAVLLRM